MMTNELGMGMALHSTPCAPISVEPATLVALDISNVVAPSMCSFCPLALPKEMVQDEHSANVLVKADKAFEIGIFLVDHYPNQANLTLKNEITSNNTMFQNLKNLDVDNSGSKGHSVTFVEPNARRYLMKENSPSRKRRFNQPLPILISHDPGQF
ncbi:hypothetical protein Ancab_035882 [Ancistrocladus abbreviatus]